MLFLLSWNGNRWTESLHFLETLFSSVKCWVPCLTEDHSVTERNSPPLRNTSIKAPNPEAALTLIKNRYTDGNDVSIKFTRYSGTTT